MRVLKGSSFLVVEDDHDMRESVLEILHEHGCTSVGARSGREALEMLRAGLRPDIILLDWVMPELNGEGFLAELRKDPDLAGLRVVLMSASNEAPKNCIEPCERVIRKPFDLAEMEELAACG